MTSRYHNISNLHIAYKSLQISALPISNFMLTHSLHSVCAVYSGYSDGSSVCALLFPDAGPEWFFPLLPSISLPITLNNALQRGIASPAYNTALFPCNTWLFRPLH